MASTQTVTLCTNAAAGTFQASDALLGGTYELDYVGTGAGTVNAQVLGPNGVTWINVGTQITTTTAAQIIQISAGQFRIVITGFTASYCNLSRLPYG
jgi:hypothetical protein